MKLANLVGERFKERPSDCVMDSHALMLRGGYMKGVAAGIYSSYTPLKRISQKIEAILRQEMDAIDGQEVSFPVALPGSLWQESGRYDTVGSELLRFTDRTGTPMLLGMTHEEAAVHLVREYGQTYNKYPFMIYQIQTKFRDEARPRAGLIRVREFTMKDGYSFHTSQQDLEEYYEQALAAYHRIFARVGIPEAVSVASDSGMMGGSLSHEFMLITPHGEDSIVICPDCGYKANMEAAACSVESLRDAQSQPLTEVHTPNIHTIDDVCEFLKTPTNKSCKAVIYQKESDNGFVALFIRGDLEVNEAKLTNFLGCGVRPAEIDEASGLNPGYIGPVGLPKGVTLLLDASLKDANNLSCGANREEYHYTGLDMAREFADAEYIDFAKVSEGGVCPGCGKKSVTIRRGIEVGNIFQLGTKYTESMNMQYTGADGKAHYPVMGCYGIGVGRLAASVCEAHHDDYGPIWPKAIAPWQVHLCAMRADNAEVKAFADELYQKLLAAGVEVIYDDRQVSAGVMFSDADLLGVPLRVIVSPRALKQGSCEVVSRDKTLKLDQPLDGLYEKILALVNE